MDEEYCVPEDDVQRCGAMIVYNQEPVYFTVPECLKAMDRVSKILKNNSKNRADQNKSTRKPNKPGKIATCTLGLHYRYQEYQIGWLHIHTEQKRYMYILLCFVAA